jgi:hypothetical protein
MEGGGIESGPDQEKIKDANPEVILNKNDNTNNHNTTHGSSRGTRCVGVYKTKQ